MQRKYFQLLWQPWTWFLATLNSCFFATVFSKPSSQCQHSKKQRSPEFSNKENLPKNFFADSLLYFMQLGLFRWKSQAGIDETRMRKKISDVGPYVMCVITFAYRQWAWFFSDCRVSVWFLRGVNYGRSIWSLKSRDLEATNLKKVKFVNKILWRLISNFEFSFIS